MARQPVNIGTIPNDGTGDPLRTAFDKVNDNFLELYDKIVEQSLVIVQSPSDLPTASGGVITQPDNVNWIISDNVDISPNRIVMGVNCAITSLNELSCKLTTSNSGALITSTYNCVFYNVDFENTGSGTIFNLNGTGLSGLSRVKIANCEVDGSRMGTISNYQIIQLDLNLFQNLIGGLTLDGTVGAPAIHTSLFTTTTSGVTLLTIPSTCTVTSRFRSVTSGFSAGSGATGLNISTSATIPIQGIEFLNVNFSGAGTPITGVQTTDLKSIFKDCRGVTNSTAKGMYYMNGNVTATTNAGLGLYSKVAGVTTSANLEKFTMPSDNRLTYAGALQYTFLVFAMGSLTANNGDEISIKVYKNGVALNDSETQVTAVGAGVYVQFSCQTFVTLSQNDYIEVYVANLSSGTNQVTVRSLNNAANRI